MLSDLIREIFRQKVSATKIGAFAINSILVFTQKPNQKNFSFDFLIFFILHMCILVNVLYVAFDCV